MSERQVSERQVSVIVLLLPVGEYLSEFASVCHRKETIDELLGFLTEKDKKGKIWILNVF